MAVRADFPAATRKLLARRAGYQCSVLNCGRLTVGPDSGSEDVVDVGMAAHIHAAAPDGPRGSGGLTLEELSSARNGIWCCYNHGKAIDADNGTIYGGTELHGWKRLHEARKGAEVHGLTPDKCGLVESIAIKSAPIAPLAGRTFDLGMLNIITGPNGAGKTMLARLITSVSDPGFLAKLSETRDVDLAVRWFDPHNHQEVLHGSGRGWAVTSLESPWSDRPDLDSPIDLDITAIDPPTAPDPRI